MPENNLLFDGISRNSEAIRKRFSNWFEFKEKL
jgi:hypothetical protein